MTSRLNRALLVLALWTLIVGSCGVWYAWSLIHSPETEPGYEKRWAFQLLMFAIFRMPWSLPFLGVGLWWSWQIPRSKDSVADAQVVK